MRAIRLLLALSSCGQIPAAKKANACASKPATYLLHYAQTGGSCGEIPNHGINVEPDGTYPGSPECESVSNEGCTEVRVRCTATKNNESCKLSTSLVFAFDGAQAEGIAELRCESCESTYALKMTRQ